MTTARDLIKRTLKKIGVLAIGETPSSEQENDAFDELNDLLSDFSNENLLVDGIQIEEFSTIASQQSYTIGSGGDWDTTVPVHIDSAYLEYSSGLDTPINIVDNQYWGRLNSKEVESDAPLIMYVDKNYPLRTAYLYPIPNSVKTIKLHSYRQFTELSSLTSNITLPRGGNSLLIYNLALRLCPEYGLAVPSEIAMMANKTIANYKRVRIQPVEVGVDDAITASRDFDITLGM